MLIGNDIKRKTFILFHFKKSIFYYFSCFSQHPTSDQWNHKNEKIKTLRECDVEVQVY